MAFIFLFSRDIKGWREAFPTERRSDDILRLRIPELHSQFSSSLTAQFCLSLDLTVPLQNSNIHVLGRRTKHAHYLLNQYIGGAIHTVFILRDNFDPVKRNLRKRSHLQVAGRDFPWSATNEWDQSPHTKLHGFLTACGTSGRCG